MNGMSFFRALLVRRALNQRLQEKVDVWRLYHFVHYWRLCGGKDVRVTKPDEISYTEQYRLVHSAVTRQVRFMVCRLVKKLSVTDASPT